MQCLEVRYVCRKHEKSLYIYDAHKFQMTSPDMKIISRKIEVIFQILKGLDKLINKSFESKIGQRPHFMIY